MKKPSPMKTVTCPHCHKSKLYNTRKGLWAIYGPPTYCHFCGHELTPQQDPTAAPAS